MRQRCGWIVSRAIGRWCRHRRDWPDCAPTSSLRRIATAGQPSARVAVGGLVGGDHVGGDAAAVADLVALIPGPLPDRLGVLSVVLRESAPAPQEPAGGDAPGRAAGAGIRRRARIGPRPERLACPRPGRLVRRGLLRAADLADGGYVGAGPGVHVPVR